MLTTLLKNNKAEPLVLTSTKLKEDFNKFKKHLEIFKELKVNEKLGKHEEDGKQVYYKEENYISLMGLNNYSIEH